MTEDDKLLFELLFDYEGILYVSEFGSDLYSKRIIVLHNKLYSDVNVQDEEGNTFLHYAMQHNNDNIIKSLILNGANPFIKNNKNQNCFAHKKVTQEKVNKFWKSLNFYFDDNFSSNVKGLHKEVIQSLFNDINIYSESNESIIKFMKDSNLFSIENIIKLSRKRVFSFNKNIINSFLELNPTDVDNTKFLYEALTFGNDYQFDNVSKKDTIDFLTTQKFSMNDNYINIFADNSFFKNNYKKIMRDDSFIVDIIKLIIKPIIEADKNNTLSKELKEKFQSHLNNYPALTSIYLTESIDNNNINIKKRKI